MNFIDMINWQPLLSLKQINPENWENVVSEMIWSYQNQVRDLVGAAAEALKTQNHLRYEKALIEIQNAAQKVGAESVQFRARLLSEADLSPEDVECYFQTLENSVTSSILQLKEFESNLRDH